MAKKEKFSAKKLIAKHAEGKTVIKYGERKQVEIIEATKHYAKGALINPHVLVADEYIKLGIAKEVK